MKWKETMSTKWFLGAQRQVKKVMLIVHQDMKDFITIVFLEKGPTVNSGHMDNSVDKIHLIHWMTLVCISIVSTKNN